MVDIFSPSALAQGREYQQQGYVINIRLSEGLLKARVKGRSGRIYHVHINLKTWPQQPAHCSCESAKNCRHAAASLFVLQAQANLDLPALAQPYQPEHRRVSGLVDSDLALVYLIELQHANFEDRVLVRLATAKRLKRGGLKKKVRLNVLTENRKRFPANDEEILNQLFFQSGVQRWFDYLSVRNSDLLEKILQTGRAYWYTDDNLQLHLGETVTASLTWQADQQGQQWPVLKYNDRGVQALLLDKAWYFEKSNLALGLLELPCALTEFKQIHYLSPVNEENVAAISYKIALFESNLALPKLYQANSSPLKPQPIVRFNAMNLDEDNALFMVDIAFKYHDTVIDMQAEQQRLFFESNNLLLVSTRNNLFEKNALNEISNLLHLRHATIHEKLMAGDDLQHQQILPYFNSIHDVPRLQTQLIPLLKSKGWKIEFLHPVYYEELDDNAVEWYAELQDQGNDFFSYQLGILIEGKPVNIVPLVVELINNVPQQQLAQFNDDKLIRLNLQEGKALKVQWYRIKPLINFLLQYGDRTLDGHSQFTLSRYQLVLIEESEQALAATTLRWQGGEQIRRQLQALKDISLLDNVAVPRGLQAVLRDYQHQGLNWLQFLRAHRFGGVLADDMGLGKTVQTLAHMQLEKELGHLTKASLIVAPTSLVMNWFEEALRFTPQLKVLIFHGQARHQDEFDDYDLVISTYGLIQRDKTRFINYPFYYLILDEAQFIKNARAKTSQIIQQIKAQHRLCLSGTPLENHLGELWSLFHFLMPGLLGDVSEFRRFFKIPIEKFQDEQRRIVLAGRVKPFMLRRNKNQVANELPDKTEMVRLVELSGAQRDLYETIRLSMEKKVRDAVARRGLAKSQIVLLDALLKLRQVCCDPKLISLPVATLAHGTSVKLDALLDLLDNLMSEGRSVLIFSQFTSMLALIEQQLALRGYLYLKLTGQTKNRQQVVNEFQTGNIPLFLISLKAGGTGLNLTRADTVIHYDPWWNPAAEDQATDRSHRIGQENPVFVYKLITKGTVEEAILAMQEKKRALFEGILAENASALTQLNESDLAKFFVSLDKQ